MLAAVTLPVPERVYLPLAPGTEPRVNVPTWMLPLPPPTVSVPPLMFNWLVPAPDVMLATLKLPPLSV